MEKGRLRVTASRRLLGVVRYRSLAFATLGLGLSLGRPAHATIADPKFQETIFASGLGAITAMAWAPDGSDRLFYLIKTGEVGIIEHGKPQATPFAIISPLMTTSECGLLGIAFDPGFASNHYLYLFATVSETEQQILRYTDNGGLGIEPKVVVGGLPTLGKNHNGGAVGIGPDGKLYWSIGDNGNGTGVGGDLLSLAAKVGRANLDGTAPADNPFVDGDGPNNDFIWARGFRNPFKFTWRPSSERLWVSVTGGAFEQIFTPKPGENAGWNKYEVNQPAGFLLPAVSYRTDAVMAVEVVANGAVRTNGLVTIKTQPRHRFVPGAKISVTGVTDTSFNGDHYILDIPTMNSFTFAQPGPDATSGSGAAATQDIGGAVTGGGFWDSSALPAPYRENFFFGDYNSGRIMRVAVGANEKVTSVDEWATDSAQSVALDAGPDGALYYAGLTGDIYRATYVATTQGIVVSNLHLRTREGALAIINVRLAKAPATSIAVSIGRASGDADLVTVGQTTLSFNASNWSTPQAAVVRAAEDIDTADDEAWFELSSPSLSTESVRVRAIDNGNPPPSEEPTANDGGAGGPLSNTSGEAGQPAATVDGASGAAPAGGAEPDGTGGSEPTTETEGGAPAGSAGAPGSTPIAPSSSCGCRVVGEHGGGYALTAAAALAALMRRRRPRA